MTDPESRLCIGKAGSTQEETCQHGTYKETNWCDGHMIVEFGSHMVDRDDVFPDPPSTDRLDALYDAACDVVAGVLNGQTNADYTLSPNVPYALQVIDRWLQRREADRQYELRRYESGVDLPEGELSAGPVRTAGTANPGFTIEEEFDRTECVCGCLPLAHESPVTNKPRRCHDHNCPEYKPRVPAQDSP